MSPHVVVTYFLFVHYTYDTLVHPFYNGLFKKISRGRCFRKSRTADAQKQMDAGADSVQDDERSNADAELPLSLVIQIQEQEAISASLNTPAPHSHDLLTWESDIGNASKQTATGSQASAPGADSDDVLELKSDIHHTSTQTLTQIPDSAEAVVPAGESDIGNNASTQRAIQAPDPGADPDANPGADPGDDSDDVLEWESDIDHTSTQTLTQIPDSAETVVPAGESDIGNNASTQRAIQHPDPGADPDANPGADPGADGDDVLEWESDIDHTSTQTIRVPSPDADSNDLLELESDIDHASTQTVALEESEDRDNQNIVANCSDIFGDAHSCGVVTSGIETLLHEDAQLHWLTTTVPEYEIFTESNEKPKVTIDPASEQTSIYYDALETLDGAEAGSSKPSSHESKSQTKPRKGGCCRLKWCCCCQKNVAEGGDAYDEDDEEPGDDTADNAGDVDYITKKTQNKSTSDTTTKGRSRATLRARSTKVSSKAVNVTSGELPPPRPSKQERRKRIPDRPDKSMSLWSVLKTAIGKDILRSPLPVNFSEPLSMLQRLAEDFEYSNILDRASKTVDQWEQLCLVAAFSVASYCNTAIRLYKPFNPLLGETYEMDRMSDLGWRYVSEQVSHHPPTAATHCEGTAGWICWQDLTMHSKWHMNTCDFNPTGVANVKFTGSGHHYTWKKVTTLVHNIVWGKLWVDQVGDTVVTNHSTGDTCALQFLASGRSQKQVKGTVTTKSGQAKWTLTGTWDDQLVASPSVKSMGNSTLLWKIKPPGPEAEKYYSMTEFACQLNELEAGVAPTDSRFRPDQRLMENGFWDEANLEKMRLEDKQRKEARKWKSEDDEGKSVISLDESNIGIKPPYVPLWFRKVRDETTSQYGFRYTKLYWERKNEKNWSMCRSIF